MPIPGRLRGATFAIETRRHGDVILARGLLPRGSSPVAESTPQAPAIQLR